MDIKKQIQKLAQAHWLFAIIATIFGMMFVVATPPLWGLDETSHFARAYQLAGGDVIPDRAQDNYGGVIPANLLTLINYTKDDLLNNSGGLFGRKDVDSSAVYKKLTDTKFSSEKAQYIWSAGYSPVAYLGPIAGVIVSNILDLTIEHTLILARLSGLLVYILLGTGALYLLRHSKLKWLFFVVALFPAVIFQASVVTADNVAIGLSLLFTALLFRAFGNNKVKPISKKILYYLFVVAMLMPLVKINYIFLSFGVLLLSNMAFGSKMNALLFKIGAIIASTMLTVFWSILAKVTGNSPISQRPDGLQVSPSDQVLAIISDPLILVEAFLKSVMISFDEYVRSATVIMGWNWVAPPAIIVTLLILGLLLAVLYSKEDILKIRKNLIYLNILSVAGILSIFFALYLAFNPVGNEIIDGIQGRYFLPFLIPIIMLIGLTIPIRVEIKAKLLPYIFTTIAAVCLLVSITYYVLVTY